MANPCKDCPLRLFSDKGYPIKGAGNILYGNMIIVPTIDRIAYKNQNITFDTMVSILKDVIKSNTGESLLNFCYITSLVKCAENKYCPITSDIKLNCFELFINEFNENPVRNILFLGKNTFDLFSNIQKYRLQHGMNYCNCNKPLNFSWNYSPGIKFYDNEKFEIFEKELIKWFKNII